MNPATEIQTSEAKPERAFARKKVASKLDPFTEQLLQMDDEQVTIQKMAEWLGAQGVETTVANISAFLISRRRMRAAKQQFDSEACPVEAFQEWLGENPHTTLEAVMERFKLVALNLSLYPGAPPEVLRLADRLATTAIRFVNAQSRVEVRAGTGVRPPCRTARQKLENAGEETLQSATTQCPCHRDKDWKKQGLTVNNSD